MTRMIYVHIPFCDSKCHYCDFVSGNFSEKIKCQYFKALKNEILLNANKKIKISSIFFGGGTPTSVNEKFIVEIVDKVGLNETLQTEHYDLIPSLNSAHSGSEVGHGLRDVLRQHFSVNRLVKVDKQHRVSLFHTQIPQSFPQLQVLRLFS